MHRRASLLALLILTTGMTANNATADGEVGPSPSLLNEMLMTISGPGGTMSGGATGGIPGGIEKRAGPGTCPPKFFDGVPVLVSPHEPYVLEEGGFAASIGYATVRYDSLDKKEIDDRAGATFLAVDYGLSRSFMIGVTLPWLIDSVNTEAFQGRTGFSDLQIRSRLWATSGSNTTSRWDAGVGASLMVPTGQSGIGDSGRVGPGMGAWILGGDLRVNWTPDPGRHVRIYSRLGGEAAIDEREDMSGGVAVMGVIVNRHGFTPLTVSEVSEIPRYNYAFWAHYAESFGAGRQQDQVRLGSAVTWRLGTSWTGDDACPTPNRVPWSMSLAGELRFGVRSNPTDAPWGAFFNIGLSHRK